MKQFRVLAGVTHDDELYFIEMENKDYFSMSGFTVRPLKVEDAVKEARNVLESDDYLWKQAVECGSTKLGFKDWVEYVLKTDGELSMIDNSLFSQNIEINEKEYIFESMSAGQHQETDLKHYFIDKTLYVGLMSIWDKYHLKKADISRDFTPVEQAVYKEFVSLSQRQNVNSLIVKAVKLM